MALLIEYLGIAILVAAFMPLLGQLLEMTGWVLSDIAEGFTWCWRRIFRE